MENVALKRGSRPNLPKGGPQRKQVTNGAHACVLRPCEVSIPATEQVLGVSGKEGPHLALELAPRGLAGGHLNDCAGDRPDVSLSPVACLLDDLGRHPVGRPLDGFEPRICTIDR